MKRRGGADEAAADDCHPGGCQEGEENEAAIGEGERKPLVPKSFIVDGAGPHPAGGRIFDLLGLRVLVYNFGAPLLLMLVASQHLIKGFVMSLTGAATQYLFASYKVVGPQLQISMAAAQLPWAMKPVIGLVSDALPVMGYNKAPYIFMTTIFGILAAGTIGLMPEAHLTVSTLTLSLFLMQFQFSTTDLLVEAKYAEKMQSRPEHGPALMAFVWIGLNVGAMAAIVIAGELITVFSPKLPFILAVPVMAFVLVPLMRNCLEETPKTREQVQATREQLFQQSEACGLCLLMFVSTLVLGIVGMTSESAELNALVSIVVAVVILAAFSVVLRPVIAKVNAFFLIQTSVGFSIGGGSFYFYTDGQEAYPEGPHFSKQFFVTVLGICSSVCAIVGIWSYQRWASKWSYRRLLLVSNLAMCVFSVPDLLMFARLNHRLGIPDHYCVLGTSILCGVIGQWMWMPGVVILSQLCPRGMEATMYALLAGCHNLGNTIASNCGALMLNRLGVNPSGIPGESHEFKNLWVCALVSMAMPNITIVLLPWLIPDALQTDKLLEEGDKSAVEGSLLQRWRERRNG